MLKLLFAFVAGVVLLIVAGVIGFVVLGDDDDDGGTSATGPSSPASTGATAADADALLQEALAAAQAVSSFHFVLSHENGTTPLPLNLQLESAEGDIAVPDRMQAEIEAEALGVNVTVNVVGIEEQTWVTNPFTRNWEPLRGTNIRDFADPAAIVESVLPSIADAELGDTAEIDGVETQQVSGSIDSGILQSSLGIGVEVWIGVDDSLPRRVRLSGPISDAESSDVVREVDLSRYNEPVEIMPPE